MLANPNLLFMFTLELQCNAQNKQIDLCLFYKNDWYKNVVRALKYPVRTYQDFKTHKINILRANSIYSIYTNKKIL